MQAAADAVRDCDWAELTADREAWETLEPAFVQAILRRRARPLPFRRHRLRVRFQPTAPDQVGDGAEYV